MAGSPNYGIGHPIDEAGPSLYDGSRRGRRGRRHRGRRGWDRGRLPGSSSWSRGRSSSARWRVAWWWSSSPEPWCSIGRGMVVVVTGGTVAVGGPRVVVGCPGRVVVVVSGRGPLPEGSVSATPPAPWDTGRAKECHPPTPDAKEQAATGGPICLTPPVSDPSPGGGRLHHGGHRPGDGSRLLESSIHPGSDG